MKEDDLEYHLSDPQDIPNLYSKWSKVMKIVLIILISIIILLIGCSILLIFLYKHEKNKYEDERDKNKNSKKNEKQEQEQKQEVNEETLEGKSIFKNKYYAKDSIKNTFKEGGDNYKSEIGNINGGKDYKVNERNIYDLYVPFSSIRDKNSIKKIILTIHGGVWIYGRKEKMYDFCEPYSDLGIITATMAYTFLNQTDKESNIYRILDEVTTVIQDIKTFLKNKYDIDENKLEMALFGHSAGAHISLLYSYMIKNPPIPLKFIVNLCGPMNLNLTKYLFVKNESEPLESIDSESIQKAIKEDKLININNTQMNGRLIVELMNCFVGNAFDKDIDKMVNGFDIIPESQEYISLYNKLKFAFPIEYVESNTLPTLCYYAGLDEAVGVTQYSQLKEKFEEKGNDKITLIYVKNSNHNYNIDKEKVIALIKEGVVKYSDLYFTKN